MQIITFDSKISPMSIERWDTRKRLIEKVVENNNSVRLTGLIGAAMVGLKIIQEGSAVSPEDGVRNGALGILFIIGAVTADILDLPKKPNNFD